MTFNPAPIHSVPGIGDDPVGADFDYFGNHWSRPNPVNLSRYLSDFEPFAHIDFGTWRVCCPSEISTGSEPLLRHFQFPLLSSVKPTSSP